MTANLLAHSDLFRAGIARSGAYNRTLTPFGFQSERRTFWEAPEMYCKMSPFMHADKIKEPILLIHGEADNNPGTFPIQSERLYQAHQGQRRHVAVRDAAARVARLRRPRVGRARPGRNDRLVRPARQEARWKEINKYDGYAEPKLGSQPGRPGQRAPSMDNVKSVMGNGRKYWQSNTVIW